MVEGKYFEDLNAGDRFNTLSRTVTEADIINFIGVSGIFEELHINVEYIKTKSIFGRRISPGPLTLAIAEGLVVLSGILHGTGLAFLEMEHVKMPRPVYCGDTITVEVEVVDKRETSKPDRGVVWFRHVVMNQKAETVMEMTKVRLIRRRNSG